MANKVNGNGRSISVARIIQAVIAAALLALLAIGQQSIAKNGEAASANKDDIHETKTEVAVLKEHLKNMERLLTEIRDEVKEMRRHEAMD